jgi:hypothetical protein
MLSGLDADGADISQAAAAHEGPRRVRDKGGRVPIDTADGGIGKRRLDRWLCSA